MNREIKFRAWNIKYKEMHSWEELLKLKEDETKERGNKTYYCYYSSLFQSIITSKNLAEKYELMQDTGLKDKNGKEIYEGDILKNINTEQIIYIKYNESRAGFSAYNNGGHELMFGFYRVTVAFEVIGNIFENKELLNK